MAQVIGAIAAAGVLFVIASGKAGFDVSAGFASNGFGAHSPDGYSMVAALVVEVVLTCFFLLVILGATDRRAPLCNRQGLRDQRPASAGYFALSVWTWSVWTVTFSSSSVLPACEVTFTL